MDHKEVSLFFSLQIIGKVFVCSCLNNSDTFTHLYLQVNTGFGVVLQLCLGCVMVSYKCSFYPGKIILKCKLVGV